MNILKDYRIKNNLTQEQVALELSITQQQYSRFEVGLSILNINQLLVLCELYKVSPNDLLGFIEEK